MKFVDFPKRNKIIGKNQPQYNPIFAFVKDCEATPDPEGSIVCRVEFTDEEIAEIIKTRGFWYTQLTFRNNFQAVRFEVTNPFYKSDDAYLQVFYKHERRDNGIWIWNACDLDLPKYVFVDGEKYDLDRTKPYGFYTAMNIQVGSYYIAEIPDTDMDNISLYGKSVLERLTGPGLAMKYKIPSA